MSTFGKAAAVVAIRFACLEIRGLLPNWSKKADRWHYRVSALVAWAAVGTNSAAASSWAQR